MKLPILEPLHRFLHIPINPPKKAPIGTPIPKTKPQFIELNRVGYEEFVEFV